MHAVQLSTGYWDTGPALTVTAATMGVLAAQRLSLSQSLLQAGKLKKASRQAEHPLYPN